MSTACSCPSTIQVKPQCVVIKSDCPFGVTGPTGPTGPTGLSIVGPVGPTGPAGPAGSFAGGIYGAGYDNSNQFIPPTLSFMPTFVYTTGIFSNPFVPSVAGVFEVTFSASISNIDANTVSIHSILSTSNSQPPTYTNSIVDSISIGPLTYGRITDTAIFNLGAGDSITLSFTLDTFANVSLPNITMSIVQIA